MTHKMAVLRLSAEKHFNLLMQCCPMCWTGYALGDWVVWPGKGTSSVCLDCARRVGVVTREHDQGEVPAA